MPTAYGVEFRQDVNDVARRGEGFMCLSCIAGNAKRLGYTTPGFSYLLCHPQSGAGTLDDLWLAGNGLTQLLHPGRCPGARR